MEFSCEQNSSVYSHCYSLKCIVCVLEAGQTCRMHFPHHKTLIKNPILEKFHLWIVFSIFISHRNWVRKCAKCSPPGGQQKPPIKLTQCSWQLPQIIWKPPKTAIFAHFGQLEGHFSKKNVELRYSWQLAIFLTLSQVSIPTIKNRGCDRRRRRAARRHQCSCVAKPR